MMLLLAIAGCALVGWILAQLFPTPVIDHDAGVAHMQGDGDDE